MENYKVEGNITNLHLSVSLLQYHLLFLHAFFWGGSDLTCIISPLSCSGSLLLKIVRWK